jgi:peptide/nickel transport system ATP-binding protein
MREIRKQMQIIFQDPYSSLPPRSTVGGILSEPVNVHKIVPRAEVKDYVLELMDKCGLRDYYYERYPHEFSGGQRQRICIARALSVKPKLVVCDEPVSALDVSIQAQIINLLKKLQREEGMSYMFISHDLSVVKYISDDIAVMYLGNIVEMGTTKEICTNAKHPHTQALFSAVPVANPHAKSEPVALEGELPSPANPPKGCKFHTRCKYCTAKCREVAPEMKDIGGGHYVSCHLADEL